MAEKLTPSRSLGMNQSGDKRAIKASYLDGDATLRQGQKIEVYDEQVPADKFAWFGHGHEAAMTSVRRKYAGLVDKANGDAIEGEVIAQVTDSSGDNVLAQRTLGDVATLAEAEAEDRSERPAMPAMEPYANPHRRLKLIIVADEASDGEKVDPAASSARFWYSQT